VFDAAIDDFREQLRLEVEERATEIFRQLTTEPQYAGLKINERYGLDIVDDEGRVIADRSAGAEQVVALSLIGALNRSAVREGPIVMDTPFGRLDVDHRANILRFLPSMSSQIVLLVQSGEVDIERDLVHLEGKIARQYRLVREGPTLSRIERIN
jgi:DNA sulfur modification protein DndD